MKLVEITDFDDKNYSIDTEKQKRSIRYMFDKLFDLYHAKADHEHRNKIGQKMYKLRQLWAQDPISAYYYARLIRQRFPEGELAIATDSALTKSYQAFFKVDLNSNNR